MHRKQYEIASEFLLNLNWKLYALYQMVMLPMTLLQVSEAGQQPVNTLLI